MTNAALHLRSQCFTFIWKQLYNSHMTDNNILLDLVADGRGAVAARLAELLGVSRQAASAKIARAVRLGILEKQGIGRGVRYVHATVSRIDESFSPAGLEEDRVWRALCLPALRGLPENVMGIWHYGVTEMLNNAIDHANATTIRLELSRTQRETEVVLSDDGEGVFLKIAAALHLFDAQEAIFELMKGKLTTAPEKHSGEGIFFTSKLFDRFEMTSGSQGLSSNEGHAEFIADTGENFQGTRVCLRLANDATRTLKSVFDQFAVPDEFVFAKTRVPMRLAQYEGETLMSRSQAKRLTQRFDRFKTVELDFAGVADIGQAFADELFRVFKNAHPEMHIEPINLSDVILKIIERVERG
jgi:anti-sigma regulatory factor (Ser/Thr protein kinase)